MVATWALLLVNNINYLHTCVKKVLTVYIEMGRFRVFKCNPWLFASKTFLKSFAIFEHPHPERWEQSFQSFIVVLRVPHGGSGHTSAPSPSPIPPPFSNPSPRETWRVGENEGVSARSTVSSIPNDIKGLVPREPTGVRSMVDRTEQTRRRLFVKMVRTVGITLGILPSGEVEQHLKCRS